MIFGQFRNKLKYKSTARILSAVGFYEVYDIK